MLQVVKEKKSDISPSELATDFQSGAGRNYIAFYYSENKNAPVIFTQFRNGDYGWLGIQWNRNKPVYVAKTIRESIESAAKYREIFVAECWTEVFIQRDQL